MVIIVLIGFLQDRLFVYLNQRLFPYKAFNTFRLGMQEAKLGFLTLLGVPMAYLLLRALTGLALTPSVGFPSGHQSALQRCSWCSTENTYCASANPANLLPTMSPNFLDTELPNIIELRGIRQSYDGGKTFIH
ncbi:MAG: hypothetical protein HC821_00470 [Lewinella sp.]|nr:hypothetical protein [Lewinella sp.]